MVLSKSCLFDGCVDIRPNKSKMILKELTKTNDRHNRKLLTINSILKCWKWSKEFIIQFCNTILFYDVET